MAARLAWTFAGTAALFVVLDVAITAQYRALTSEAAIAVHGIPFVSGAVLGSAVMGALIIARDRRQVIGWLLLAVGTAGAFSLVTEAYAVWVLDHGGPGSRAQAGVTGWLSSLFGGQLAITGMVFLFLLVPDGRFLSSRWRIAAVVAVCGETLVALGTVVADPRTFDLTDERASGGSAARDLLNFVGFVLISVGLVAALVCMVVRLRRSTGVERQQLRVVALSAASLCASIVWLFVAEAMNTGPQGYVTVLPLFVSYLFFPILLAVAVLRYRLYDVDVIVNRTLVVSLGTAFAGLGYVALVVGVGDLVVSRTSAYWLSVGATVVVAVAFQPLRRTVVTVANRMAFGPRAQPYDALAEFSRRLSVTPSAGTVLSAVADAAGRAVSARGATASLDAPGLDRSSAHWGSDDADTVHEHEHEVPVLEGGVVLGRIGVSIPAGRPLRATDVRLLRAIADLAAVAFHNLAMEAQLEQHVLALNRTTQELADSRSRIVGADDAARRSLSAGISRDVLPPLLAVSRVLGAHEGTAPPSASCIEDLLAGVHLALESLREMTHGVFPAQLTRSGLEPALRPYLRRRGPHLSLDVAPGASGRRFAPRVEAAVWFAITRSVTAGGGVVVLDVDGNNVLCSVSGARPQPLDLQSIRDRVDAVGGTVRLRGGSLQARVPIVSGQLPSGQLGSESLATPSPASVVPGS